MRRWRRDNCLLRNGYPERGLGVKTDNRLNFSFHSLAVPEIENEILERIDRETLSCVALRWLCSPVFGIGTSVT